VNILDFIKTIDGGSGASEENILLFEEEIGKPLPRQFRDFLKLTSGGNNDDCHVDGFEVAISYVGGVAKDSIHQLSEARNVYQVEDGFRIPKDLLWIMDDGCGNAICIAFCGDNEGQIFLWLHENEYLMYDKSGNNLLLDYTSQNAPNIEFVAKTFNDFIDKIELFDESEY